MKDYIIQIQNPCGNPYLTINAKTDEMIGTIHAVLSNEDFTKNVNINTTNNLKRSVTVHINPCYSPEECSKLCAAVLDKTFNNPQKSV